MIIIKDTEKMKIICCGKDMDGWLCGQISHKGKIVCEDCFKKMIDQKEKQNDTN